MIIKRTYLAIIFCLIPMASTNNSDFKDFDDKNLSASSEEYNDEDSYSKYYSNPEEETALAKDIILQFLEVNTEKRRNNQPNVFDLLKQLSFIVTNEKDDKRDINMSLNLKEVENHYDNINRSKKVKREVKTNEEPQVTNAGSEAKTLPHVRNDENSQNKEHTKFGKIISLNSSPSTETITITDQTAEEQVELRNNDVNNFQDSNVTITYDSTTNDTATTPVRLVERKPSATNVSLQSDVDPNVTPKTISLSQTQKDNGLLSIKFRRSNLNPESNEESGNKSELLDSAGNVSVSYNITRDETHIPYNNNDINSSANNESIPVLKFQSEPFNNVETNRPEVTVKVHDKNANKSSKNVSQTDVGNSHSESLKHKPGQKLPLSSRQLSHLQNVLSDNFSVRSQDSQPVAKLHLDKSKSDDKPVIVVVYNCSCGHHAKKHNSMPEHTGFVNTRRMVKDSHRTDDDSIQNGVSNNQDLLPVTVFQDETIVSSQTDKEKNTVNDKSSNVINENAFLSKCKSLLAVQSEKETTTNKNHNDLVTGHVNKQAVKSTVTKPDLRTDTVLSIIDVTSNNSNNAINNKTQKETNATLETDQIITQEEGVSNTNGKSKQDKVVPDVIVQATNQSDNETDTSKIIRTKRHNTNINKKEFIKSVKKRDTLGDFTNILKSMLQIPANSVNLVLDSVPREEHNNRNYDNRSKREVIMKDSLDYSDDIQLLDPKIINKSLPKVTFSGKQKKNKKVSNKADKHTNLNNDVNLRNGKHTLTNKNAMTTALSARTADAVSHKWFSEVVHHIRPIEINIYLDLLMNKSKKSKGKNKKYH